MIEFNEKIIELDIVDLDEIIYHYCWNHQTLIVEKSSEKNLYLLREKTLGDENYSDVVVGISEDIKEIKNKMSEYIGDNKLYYRLVGDIDKEENLLRGSLSGFGSIKDKKRLEVQYKTYKAQTELGKIFLVDVLVTVFDEDDLIYDEINNYAFFSEKEMGRFIDETFRNQITQELSEY